MRNQAPTVGQIVHYYDKRDANLVEPLAAIITRVHSWAMLELTVLPPGQIPVAQSAVMYSRDPMTGCWSWPPV